MLIAPEQYSLHINKPFQQVAVKPDGNHLRICVISKDSEQELLLQQTCGELTVPMPVLESRAIQSERELGTAGLQVLALEGGELMWGVKVGDKIIPCFNEEAAKEMEKELNREILSDFKIGGYRD